MQATDKVKPFFLPVDCAFDHVSECMCVSVCVYAIADRRAGKMLPLLMEIKDSILIHTDTHTHTKPD